MTHTITHDTTRALAGARRAEISDASFPAADALRDARELTLGESSFSAPRPLAHVTDAILRAAVFTSEAVSPLTRARTVTLQGCEMDAPRGCEEAKELTVDASRIHSDGFAASASHLTMTDSVLSGRDLLDAASDLTISNIDLTGDYALHHVRGGRIDFSTLAGEDLLRGAKDLTISDTVLDGARIGWYSENLTLSHCVIAGEKPFAYAKGLTLIDCALDPTCIEAFEHSEVEATIRGSVPSILNPAHGSIVADAFGEILFDDTALPGTDCKVMRKCDQ